MFGSDQRNVGGVWPTSAALSSYTSGSWPNTSRGYQPPARMYHAAWSAPEHMLAMETAGSPSTLKSTLQLLRAQAKCAVVAPELARQHADTAAGCMARFTSTTCPSNTFMFSQLFSAWGCRCCEVPAGGSVSPLWSVYAFLPASRGTVRPRYALTSLQQSLSSRNRFHSAQNTRC